MPHTDFGEGVTAVVVPEKGVKLDRRHIELKDPIRTLGLSEVTIRLHPEVSATLRVEVIKG